ncbi:acyl-CoA thioesterase [Saccharospirillum sp.]|uniref:acyl-CoA thioesterase n=1 Tax=Saccharospirillum sp. TaxID=2033801 RepID=UPI0034A09113
MTIDELLEQARQAGTENTMSVPDSWGQGRTVYGGLSAGLAYQVMRASVSADRVLRSLSVSFVGPVATDAPLGFQVEVLREGKNVTQVEARVVQDGQVGVAMLASFGQARTSVTGVKNTETPPFSRPEQPVCLPFIPKVTPQFFQNIDVNLIDGNLAFTGADTSHHGGFMQFREAPATLTDAHLITLIDAWPPTLLQQLKTPAPASTLAWNLEFLHPHAEVPADAWFGYRAITRQAGEGYGHTEANVWNAHGDLIAISRQTITVFA